MYRILARQLVRLALVLASLAWLAFVFTHTIGDPSRSEAVASAVLADPAARAEVAAPIASSVVSTFGLPAELRPVVESEVDRLLGTPTGSRSFVEPFAGSWARLLGEDDPRPAEFDVAPLLDEFAAETGVPVSELPDRLFVPAVPMPRTQLEWMAGVRSGVAAAILPMALAAAVLFATAFALGERARVLRRIGVWGLVAGGSWLAIAPVAVWLTRRWAPGADAVVAAALEEATSGLVGAAIVLGVGGACALVLSFAVRSLERDAGPPSRRSRGVPPPGATIRAAPVAEPRSGAGSPATAQAPVGPRTAPDVTTAVVPQHADGINRTDARQETDDDSDEDADSVWEFYA